MKKIFCDNCEGELSDAQRATVEGSNFEVKAEKGAVLLVIAQPLENPKYKYEDLCIECFFDIFSKYDTRPRPA